MFRRPLKLVIAAALATVASAALASTNPIAAYNLNDTGTTAVDQSGNNHHGTLIDGPAWTAGKNAGGLAFDGYDDYVSMGDVAQADNLVSFTVSTWVKFKTSSGAANETHLVDKSECSGYTDGGPWELGVTMTQTHKAEVLMYPQGGSPYSYVFSGASQTSVDDGNWHYVTGRYDGTELSIWVDGVKENSVAAPGITTANSSHQLELGGHCNGYAYPFKGTLDDIRIYDRALSAAEIQSDMNTPVGGSAPPPPPPPPPPPVDTTPPNVSITAPVANATVSGTITIAANASDNVAVVGVQFRLDGASFGVEDTAAPYSISWNTKTTTNGVYTLSAIARDAAGNQQASTPMTVTVVNDSSAPSRPTNLHATDIATTSIALVWNPSIDDVGVTGYEIIRNSVSIGVVNSASFTDSGLDPDTSYAYSVRAFDASGKYSSASTTIVVRTTAAPVIDTTPPTVPDGLHTASATTSQIVIAWDASSDNVGVVGYHVYRNGFYIGTTSTTSYIDSGLAPSTAYTYAVDAFDEPRNESAQSSPWTASTIGNSATSFTTNFDLTESPISENGAWHRAGNAYTDIRTADGTAYGTNGAADEYDDSYALLSGFGPDYSVEATIYRSPNLNGEVSHETELLLRFEDDENGAHGYEVLFAYYGAIQIIRWNGSMGDYTILEGYGGPGGPGGEFESGDVIKATISGNIIRVYVNGQFMTEATDDAFTSGQPGIGFFTRPGGDTANFCVTNFTVTNE